MNVYLRPLEQPLPGFMTALAPPYTPHGRGTRDLGVPFARGYSTKPKTKFKPQPSPKPQPGSRPS